MSALAGGATLTRVTPLTIPAGVRPGTYYLIACADDLAQTAESDERNNCRAASGPVEVTRPASDPMPARR